MEEHWAAALSFNAGSRVMIDVTGTEGSCSGGGVLSMTPKCFTSTREARVGDGEGQGEGEGDKDGEGRDSNAALKCASESSLVRILETLLLKPSSLIAAPAMLLSTAITAGMTASQ